MSADWKGEWIQLSSNGDWVYHRCVRCGRALTDAEHRELGLGPECRKVDPVLADRLRENARAADRKNLRRERWYQRFGEQVKTKADELSRMREQGR